MEMYMVALLAAVLALISVLLCIRFIFSRGGLVWIPLTLVSAGLTVVCGLCVWFLISPDTAENIIKYINAAAVILSLISVLWLIFLTMIRTSHSKANDRRLAELDEKEARYLYRTEHPYDSPLSTLERKKHRTLRERFR